MHKEWKYLYEHIHMYIYVRIKQVHLATCKLGSFSIIFYHPNNRNWDHIYTIQSLFGFDLVGRASKTVWQRLSYIICKVIGKCLKKIKLEVKFSYFQELIFCFLSGYYFSSWEQESEKERKLNLIPTRFPSFLFFSRITSPSLFVCFGYITNWRWLLDQKS